MFYCSNITCPTDALIRCSTIAPSDVPLFHHLRSTVPPSDVPLLQHQTFYCSSIRRSTVPPSDVPLLHCLCSTVPPSHVSLLHYDCSTVPPSDCPLFHHLCYIVPQFLFPCSIIAFPVFHHDLIYCSTVPDISVVLRFHNQIFHCSPISVPLFHHQMFYCSTIRCSTFPP